MKWHRLTVGCSVMDKNSRIYFYYFDNVQIPEQFTSNLTSGTAALQSYLRQAGANFVLYFPFFSKNK
jgi:hypothetical protein